MQAQFDHLAETYFDGFEHDLAERELAYALAFDHELDVLAASIALTKTSVAAVLRDEGEPNNCLACNRDVRLTWSGVDTVVDMGGMDIDIELFQPLQRVLDQCKAAKTMSR
jgi:dynactin 1